MMRMIYQKQWKKRVEHLGIRTTKSETSYNDRKSKKKKSGLKLFGKIILVLVILLGILVGYIFWYLNDKFGKMQQVEIDEGELRNFWRSKFNLIWI